MMNHDSKLMGLSAVNKSYRFAAFLVVRSLFVIFLVGFEGGSVNDIQALCPLPIESTQLLFAVKQRTHTHRCSQTQTPAMISGLTSED